MKSTDSDCLKQLDALIAANNQAWLFGAGISLNAGIPLMAPLTSRVMSLAQGEEGQEAFNVLTELQKQLPNGTHIEHILSQLSDYTALADRSKNQTVRIGDISINKEQLCKVHNKILSWIADTVRWGYKPSNGEQPELIGSPTNPIVSVNGHKAFIGSLFNRGQAGIAERRTAVRLFTTNYDTLLEDALALCCCSYWDGFSGGAVAYRSYQYGMSQPDKGYRAHVIKLHGSIDWHLGEDDRVWRVRDGDLYPDQVSRVLIYPQATKYIATQRDPFASQFDLFRRFLGPVENVLITCGYSYGDEHINQEIELSLRNPENRTTILAFSKDLNSTLNKWRELPWAKRLYIMAEDGIYIGQEGPFFAPSEGKKLNWWTFEGVTNILSNGAEAIQNERI